MEFAAIASGLETGSRFGRKRYRCGEAVRVHVSFNAGICQLFAEAGFPSGDVNVFTGDDTQTGVPLVEHPDVEKITFTGSDNAGQKIYQAAAKKIMSATLELGRKSPNIVFEDISLEVAVMEATPGVFAAKGQTCITGFCLIFQR